MFKRSVSIAAIAAILALGLAAFGLGAGLPAVQAADAPAQRINFAPGASSFALTASLAQGMPQSYLLGIRGGQTLYITQNGSATLQVFDPHGNLLAGPSVQPGPWGTMVPESGDYTVTLAGSGAVTVVFYIPPAWQPAPWPVPWPGQVTRIRFARGASSASFDAVLQAGVPAGYLLRLGAGQQMFVTVDGNATASLLNPFDGAVAPAATGPGQWQFPLQWTGDYQLILQGAGQEGVTVTVPPTTMPPQGATRIRFAAGNAGTTFTTNLVPGTPSRYVLSLLAGQTLYVEVMPGDATVTVAGPDGRDLHAARSGRPGLWIATIGQTGDTTFSIQGQGPADVEVFVPPL